MSVASVPVRFGRRVRRLVGGGPVPQRRPGAPESSTRSDDPVVVPPGPVDREPAPHGTACNAPFASMYLDHHGLVRACCMNDFQVLGDVREQGLRDIWHGPEAVGLRRAVEGGDLTLGCQFCQWQVDAGRPDLAFARWFDDFPVAGPDPAWPQQLELSISNTCNLQCVMCNGEWSSAIRTQREGRAPLPSAYDDRFFDELAHFVPHLRRVKLLGGEPFLASETLRVMDVLVEHGPHVRCHVTTNGTQWTPRVERVLDRLAVDVSVSLDAATAGTYESIRVGASWDRVQDHLDRFCARVGGAGGHVSVTMCLMIPNWREFWEFCAAADARGIECAVNTVTQPSHLSLYLLPTDDLARVVDELEAVDAGRGADLGRSRAVWSGELEKLRRHLEDKRADRLVTGLQVRRHNPRVVRPFAEDREPDDVPPPVPDLPGPYLVLDRSQRVTSVGGGDAVLDVPARDWVGRSLDELADVVALRHGDVVALDAADLDGGRQRFEVEFDGGRRASVTMVPFVPGGASGPAYLHADWHHGAGPSSPEREV